MGDAMRDTWCAHCGAYVQDDPWDAHPMAVVDIPARRLPGDAADQLTVNRCTPHQVRSRLRKWLRTVRILATHSQAQSCDMFDQLSTLSGPGGRLHP
jgi:hypothetical protein